MCYYLFCKLFQCFDYSFLLNSSDETLIEEPEKFDPSRFSKENKNGKYIGDVPFLSFGEGPRACIASRMGKMFVKVGVCSILQRYHIDIDERHTGYEPNFALFEFVVAVEGIFLKFKEKNGTVRLDA